MRWPLSSSPSSSPSPPRLRLPAVHRSRVVASGSDTDAETVAVEFAVMVEHPRPLHPPPLHGVAVCITGFSRITRVELEATAVALGATFSHRLDSTVTHLLLNLSLTPDCPQLPSLAPSQEPHSPSFSYSSDSPSLPPFSSRKLAVACKRGIFILNQFWLIDCSRLKRRVEEAFYLNLFSNNIFDIPPQNSLGNSIPAPISISDPNSALMSSSSFSSLSKKTLPCENNDAPRAQTTLGQSSALPRSTSSLLVHETEAKLHLLRSPFPLRSPLEPLFPVSPFEKPVPNNHCSSPSARQSNLMKATQNWCPFRRPSICTNQTPPSLSNMNFHLEGFTYAAKCQISYFLKSQGIECLNKTTMNRSSSIDNFNSSQENSLDANKIFKSFVIVPLACNELKKIKLRYHSSTPIRTDIWLWKSFKNGKILSESDSVFYSPIEMRSFAEFSGKNFKITGIDDCGKYALQQLIAAAGGNVIEDFVRFETSYLICDAPEGEKFEKAIEWGIPVVSTKWFLDIAKKKCYVEPRFFFLKPKVVLKKVKLYISPKFKKREQEKNRYLATFLGADVRIGNPILNSCTHVVIPRKLVASGIIPKELQKLQAAGVHVVSSSWLVDCKAKSQHLDELNYYAFADPKRKLQLSTKAGCDLMNISDAIVSVKTSSFEPTQPLLEPEKHCSKRKFKQPQLNIEWKPTTPLKSIDLRDVDNSEHHFEPQSTEEKRAISPLLPLRPPVTPITPQKPKDVVKKSPNPCEATDSSNTLSKQTINFQDVCHVIEPELTKASPEKNAKEPLSEDHLELTQLDKKIDEALKAVNSANSASSSFYGNQNCTPILHFSRHDTARGGSNFSPLSAPPSKIYLGSSSSGLLALRRETVFEKNFLNSNQGYVDNASEYRSWYADENRYNNRNNDNKKNNSINNGNHHDDNDDDDEGDEINDGFIENNDSGRSLRGKRKRMKTKVVIKYDNLYSPPKK